MKSEIKHYLTFAVPFLFIIAISIAFAYRLNQERSIANSNIIALQDTLSTMRLKNGGLVMYNNAILTTNSKLASTIKDQDGHIKELEKKVGKLQAYTQVSAVYEIDSVTLRDTIVIVNDRQCVGFGYNDPWLLFEGLNCDSTITLSKLRLNTSIEVGLTKDNIVTVTSPCPYLKVTDIKSVVKAEKKKNWNVGLQVGFGAGYDVVHNGFFVGPYVGVGLAYGFDF